MTPTDRAAELPDLHNQIMNLPCKKIPGDVLNLYAYGHRDARHAAAELANHAAAIVAEQEREIAELTTCMREAQDSSLELGYQLHRLREAVEVIANDTNGCIQERLRAALTEVTDGKPS